MAFLLVFAYFLSLAGALIALALWRPVTRSLIADFWFSAELLQTFESNHIRENRIYASMIATLYLSKRGKVSILKTFTFGIISAIFCEIAMRYTGQSGGPGWPTSFQLQIFLTFTVPAHWLFEYLAARAFTNYILAESDESLYKAVLRAVAKLIAAILFNSMLLAFVVVPLMITIFWPFAQHSNPSFLTVFPSALVFNGPFLLVINLIALLFGDSVDKQQTFNSMSLLFTLLSTGTILIAAVLVLIASQLLRARRGLQFLARTCELVESVNPITVLSISLSLNAVATGAMQAHDYLGKIIGPR